MDDLEQQTVVISLDEVMRYFAKDFSPREGEIVGHDYYIDTSKGKVVFVLTINKQTT